MDYSLLVSGLQRLRNLLGDAERLIDGDRTTRDPPVQALAVNEFEHEELRPVRLVQPVNLCDVRMVEGSKHLCFAAKAREPFGIGA